MTPRPAAAGQDAIPLARLLANTAGALGQLAQSARDLDEGLGDWLDGAARQRPPAALLQEVDRMRQACECLEILLKNLARGPLPDHPLSRAEAVRGVFLRDLRDACLGI